jgi:DNA uptake protein ComE-like DNA-binding protein
MIRHGRKMTVMAVGLLFAGFALAAYAQVGKGLVDPNVASEAELQRLPGITPQIAAKIVQRRPFLSILELNSFLMSEKLTPAQATEVYKKAFVHINLNTGTREEFLLVPGAGAKMAHEFEEYRPWKTWTQFDKEIGKYVGPQETERFKQYMFIPINLNTATDEQLLTIPGAGQRMAHEFKEYRPWKTKAQFEKEIGKYVGPKETARFWRYFVIQ